MRANAAAGADSVADCAAEVAAVFAPEGDGDALTGLAAWMTEQGLPRLADYGATDAMLPDLAAQGRAASSSQKNAVPLPVDTYETILREAL